MYVFDGMGTGGMGMGMGMGTGNMFGYQGDFYAAGKSKEGGKERTLRHGGGRGWSFFFFFFADNI